MAFRNGFGLVISLVSFLLIDAAKKIHELHESMARDASAIVAPVCLAKDEALQRELSVGLYADDGNHQSIHGALLMA